MTNPDETSSTPTTNDNSPPASLPKAATEKTAAVQAKSTLTSSIIYALVIDDEHANRDFLMRLLQQAKFETKGAALGSKALEIVGELGDSIRLIMLDHQLPDQSGMELLAALRPLLPEARIVMATMHDEPGMMHKAFAGGCNAFLVKPHGFMELFKLVQGVTVDPSCLHKLDGLIFDLHGPRRYRPPSDPAKPAPKS